MGAALAINCALCRVSVWPMVERVGTGVYTMLDLASEGGGEASISSMSRETGTTLRADAFPSVLACLAESLELARDALFSVEG